MTRTENKFFSDRHLTLYFRPRDGIYAIPSGIILGGGNYDVEPFEHIPIAATVEEVWETILKVFPGANRVVPQPKSFSEQKPWYRKAGVTKWSQFAGKAKRIMSVTETQTDYQFQYHYYERGVVYGDRETLVAISKHASRNEILAVLDRFLKQSEPGTQRTR